MNFRKNKTIFWKVVVNSVRRTNGVTVIRADGEVETNKEEEKNLSSVF